MELLTKLRKAKFLNSRNNQRFFLVSTNGHTASKWLAKILDSHPEVVCTHGAADKEFSLDHVRLDDDLSPTERERRRSQSAARKSYSLKTVFEELRSFHSARVYGNVHMFTLPEVVLKISRENNFNDLRFVNLIRHPVTRIRSPGQSQKNLLSTKKSFHDDERAFEHWKKLKFDFVTHQARRILEEENCLDLALPSWFLTPKLENIASLEACSFIFEARELAMDQARHPEIYTATKEKITTDPNYLRLLLIHLLGEDIVTPDFVKNALEVPAFNVREGRDFRRELFSPQRVFNAWPDWQQELFSRICEKYNFGDIYQEQGYDFSFAQKKSN